MHGVWVEIPEEELRLLEKINEPLADPQASQSVQGLVISLGYRPPPTAMNWKGTVRKIASSVVSAELVDAEQPAEEPIPA